MDELLKDALDAAKYRVKAKQPEQDKALTDEHGNEYEDDSWLTDELLEALRTKGDNER